MGRKALLPKLTADLIAQFDASKLKDLPEKEKVDGLVGAAISVTSESMPESIDAANVLIPLKLYEATEKDNASNDWDLRLLDESFRSAKESSGSDPEKMDLVRQIYLRLRKKVFNK